MAWVAGYIPRWYACPKMVTRPSINRARCRVTSLIRPTLLLLCQIATVYESEYKFRIFFAVILCGAFDTLLYFVCMRCLFTLTTYVVVFVQFRQITDKSHQKISDMVFNVYK